VTTPSVAQVWEWLEDVPDPEIPAISIVDLGIVRRVAWTGDAAAPELHVAITPTYSGCPATTMIQRDIVSALHGRGLDRVRLDVELSPPWSTSAISAGGHDKLRAYGIAPPDPGIAVACPRCGSTVVECTSTFGSTPCKALYRCTACREPFDRFKCH
jgi:ring-1,2-phenylacetyl-CoA epoxidase subunit PaaD